MTGGGPGASGPELSRPIAVGRLSPGSSVYSVKAKPAERAALASRFGLISIERLEAEVTLQPVAGGMIRLDASLEAEVTQACVVTLDPVKASVKEDFSLLYGDVSEEEEVLQGDEELVLEPLDGDVIDIGEAVAQQLSLGLDPFPRSEAAAAFPEEPAAIVDEIGEERVYPFAELANRLKTSRPKKS